MHRQGVLQLTVAHVFRLCVVQERPQVIEREDSIMAEAALTVADITAHLAMQHPVELQKLLLSLQEPADDAVEQQHAECRVQQQLAEALKDGTGKQLKQLISCALGRIKLGGTSSSGRSSSSTGGGGDVPDYPQWNIRHVWATSCSAGWDRSNMHSR
jgi:hypothetical protein